MQAVILAAGVGKRLQSQTGGLPKSFLEVGGERIIDRNLRLLEERGVEDMIMVVGYRKELLERQLGRDKIRFVFNPFYAITNVLASFWFGQPFLNGDFIYLHADTIFSESLLDRVLQAEGPAILPVDRKMCGSEEMKVQLKDDIVVAISKDLPTALSDGEFIGLARFDRPMLPLIKEAVDQLMVEGEFDAFFEAALQRLIDSGAEQLRALFIEGEPWQEIDSPEDLENARRRF